MCGIYGEFPFNNKIEPRKLINSLNHRGPDDNNFLIFEEGIFVHTRLAIIDLSIKASQPMSSKCGRFHIIYNGEIYNFFEIKKFLITKGYQFYSDSDTEVILVGFQEWGINLFNKLNGMFAFSIYDKENQDLYLVRDRIGIKPLYYIHNKNKIKFSSEIKSFKLSLDLNLNKNSFFDLLQYGSSLENKTIFNDVYSLEPGHYIRLKVNCLFEKKKYIEIYDQSYSEYKDLSYNETKIILREKLDNAVNLQLISDTPVGCLLSGGIDSTAILALAQSKNPSPIYAFNLSFSHNHKSYDESNEAKNTASILGAKFQSIEINSENISNSFEHFISSLDQPSNDGFNTFLISKYVSKFVKVALTGLGGDELFSGYTFYNNILKALNSKPKFYDGILSKIHEIKNNRFTYSHNFRNLGPFQSVRSFRKLFTNSELRSISKGNEYIAPDHKISNLSILKQILISEMSEYLPNTLLRNTDNLSMAHSLELRPVLLENDVFNMALNISDEFKITKIRQKSILIDAVSDLIPNEVIKNSNNKRGFELPYSHYLNNELNDKTISLFESDILDEFLNNKFKKDLLNRAYKRKLQDRHWIFLIMYSWFYENNMRYN